MVADVGDRAALRLGTLGRRVKMMPGGLTGWLDEALPLETGRRTV